jgi:hypothetical protein
MIQLLVMLLLFTATTAYSEDDPLEQLVQTQNLSLFSELESLTMLTSDELLEVKIHQVLKKRKVMRPQYYAKLIAHSKYTMKEKHMAVALLVPESRGNAKAVNYNGTCFGAWQVNKGWKKKLGIKGSLFDPPVCLDAAIQVWNIHLKDARGSNRAALVAYSGGAKGYVDKIAGILNELKVTV